MTVDNVRKIVCCEEVALMGGVPTRVVGMVHDLKGSVEVTKASATLSEIIDRRSAIHLSADGIDSGSCSLLLATATSASLDFRIFAP